MLVIRMGTQVLRFIARTPEEAFGNPILLALYEAGSTKCSEVLDRVEDLMNQRLTGDDRQRLSSGEIRSRNTARWKLKRMREQGLVTRISHGLYKLTAAGTKAAEAVIA